MKKVNYKWTLSENYNIPDNNYSCEIFSEYFEDNDYTFLEYLTENCDLQIEQENNTFYVLDCYGDRTGEAYLLISEDIIN